MLCACKPNAETIQKKSGLSVEKKIISRTIHDEMSPLGFWEIKIEYPTFGDSTKNPALKTINNEISSLAEKYLCDDNKGDKQFIATITFLNPSIVSIQYSDSWLCAGMPHPDGKIGALTYNVKTGKAFILDEEINAIKKNDFSQNVIAKLNQSLKENGNDSDCGQVSTWSHFYRTDTGLTFVYTPDDYSESYCTSETQISTKDMGVYLNKTSPLLIQ